MKNSVFLKNYEHLLPLMKIILMVLILFIILSSSSFAQEILTGENYPEMEAYRGPWFYATSIFVIFSIIMFILTTIVICIGGYFDLIWMFRELKESEFDETDDGRVPTIES